MKKRIANFLLCIGMIIGMLSFPVHASASTISSIIAEGTCGEAATWTLTESGDLTICGNSSMTDWTSSSQVPWYAYRSQISRITILDGITTIGNNAFQNFNQLYEVNLPESITHIGSSSFSYCAKLSQFIVPESVTSIGSSAFYECGNLKKIIIPENVISIGDQVFLVV